MKLVKTASGKQTIKISKKEWQSIGKKAGWMKKAMWDEGEERAGDDDDAYSEVLNKAKEAVALMEESFRNNSLQGKEDAYGMLRESILFAPVRSKEYFNKKEKESELASKKEMDDMSREDYFNNPEQYTETDAMY
jgi:hypothetical protein